MTTSPESGAPLCCCTQWQQWGAAVTPGGSSHHCHQPMIRTPGWRCRGESAETLRITELWYWEHNITVKVKLLSSCHLHAIDIDTFHASLLAILQIFLKHYKCNIWPDPNLPGMASNHPEIPVRPARGLKSQRDKSQSNENDKNKVKIFDHKNLYFKFWI